LYAPRHNLLLAILVLSGAACTQAPGHPPVARVTATPKAIPEHDDFQTDVMLDGSASADPIDDPTGASPLRYEWAFTNDEAHVVSGTTSDAKLTVRWNGMRPGTVHLTVTDIDDQSSTALYQMQLTIPSP
jgi:hypothetical protein